MTSAAARTVLSQLSFAVGSVWAVAGGGRLIFGERITLPILPALDLHQVQTGSALAVALGCFALAAVLGRGASAGRAASADPDRGPLVGTAPTATDGDATGDPASLLTPQQVHELPRTQHATRAAGRPTPMPSSERL